MDYNYRDIAALMSFDESLATLEQETLRGGLIDLFRKMLHIRHMTIPTLNVPDDNANADLRRKFLMKEIDETDWKKALQQREKKREKNVAFRNLYQLAYDISCDSLRTVTGRVEDMKRVGNEIENLIHYVNDGLAKVSKRFNCAVPYHLATFKQILAKVENSLIERNAKRALLAKKPRLF